MNKPEQKNKQERPESLGTLTKKKVVNSPHGMACIASHWVIGKRVRTYMHAQTHEENAMFFFFFFRSLLASFLRSRLSPLFQLPASMS